MEKISPKRTYITEKELIEIFYRQYNDIFPEILILDQVPFFNQLKKQVMAYLEIVKKHSPPILLKKVEEIFVKKFLEEKDVVCKDFEYIKNSPKEQFDFLDRLNCIIHCPKSKNPLHTCGFRFILYGDYVFCIYCMKVFNEHQVNMYCDECDVEYYTKLREIVDYNLESYFLISISDYHCYLEQEEKIKCPECERDIYVDITSPNNYNRIEEATCLYCNFVFDVNLFSYECRKCGENFRSDAKIYNTFYNKQNDLLCRVHALSNKKLCFPESLLNKSCECAINKSMKFRHDDRGILYEGDRNGEKVIVCDKCLKIFDYYYFEFSCPLCNKKFNQPYIEEYSQQINSGQEKCFFSSKEINKFENDARNTSFIQKNTKGQCSSTNKNIKKENLIDNPFSTKNKILKSDNKKENNIKNYKKSKTFREKEKEQMKNNLLNHPLKHSGQKINIKIQNFYNNYVPIIHIVEKNGKNYDRNKDSKYLLNRNYTLIHTSPKVQKINTNMVNASKYISNAAFLKRSITETTKYNLALGNSAAFTKKRRKFLKEDKEKEPNINFANNIWVNNNRKKYSASFTLISSDSNNNNFSDQTIINQSTTNNHKSPNRELRKRYSSENKIKNKIDKNKKKTMEKFNTSEIIPKNKNMSKVNPIKEIKEEYVNEIKEIKIKKPKSILKLHNTNNNNEEGNLEKSNKKIKKITINVSLSNEKDKKLLKTSDKKIDTNGAASNQKIIKLKSKPNLNNKEKNQIKSNNKNIISLKGSNIPKGKRPKKNIKDTKKLEESQLQIIKDFNSEEFNIIDMLGEGTFSQIFLVENGKTKERFALKKMTATKLENLEEKKEEFELILKLKNEDEKLSLVKIYGIQIKKLDKFNMVLYILMEAAKSDWETELKNRHYAKNFYKEEELKNILIALVHTFSSLQKKGICHRDVKPQNILYFDNEVYKITDFGEAKANKNRGLEKNTKFNFSQDTSVQTVRGTELYMSPILFNALRNSPGDDLQYNAFKSDVFSLGLCFLLAGSLSYKPLSELRDLTDMDKIKMIVEKYLKNRYSKNFVDILFSMLQVEEKDRPDFIELENIIKQNL